MTRFRLALAMMFLLPLIVGAGDKDVAKETVKPTTRFVGRLVNINKDMLMTVQLHQEIITNRFRSNGRLQRVRRGKNSNVELQIDEGVTVRVAQPPSATDENGKPRKRSAKELKELKGPDPKLPGYTASYQDLKPRQVVEVYLGQVKGSGKATGTSIPKKATQTKKTADSDQQVLMIVIVQAAPPGKPPRE